MSDPFFNDIQDVSERKARLLESARQICDTLRSEFGGLGERGEAMLQQVDTLDELVRLIAEIDSGTA
ncbi:hypothetical protein [Coralloluteibacterium stylophorae]|uniref:Uncharacterized protein n=1 Tax=Coralloluteibacterium stylophorae TaxID=1776034 RepID=A0A8J7VT65_9GAMM|nr:hypothetical protein [Coralloluteibacterium stylophorae]MBS7457001.1 hypothetical protein [Coralloluteibacterium stylophorae]